MSTKTQRKQLPKSYRRKMGRWYRRGVTNLKWHKELYHRLLQQQRKTTNA